MNEFEKAKHILQGERWSQSRLQAALAKKAEWDDPEDVALYRSSMRQQDRVIVLSKLVPARVCPGCGRGPLPESRQWVINKRGTVAVCRQCFAIGRKSLSVQVSVEIFGDPVIRYPIDGRKLEAAREKAKISAKRFAELAGWSRQHQFYLERGPALTISSQCAETILQVFKEAGAKVVDLVEKQEDE